MARRFLLSTAALSATKVLVTAAQILVLPILARYLSVEEFGLVALAMSVVIFGQILSDAGLGRSLIRRPTVDGAEWNSVFWLLVGIGLGLGVALLAIAPLWARVFGQPPLASMVAALAVIPLLQAISAVPIARMERADRFPAIAVIRLVAAAVAVTLSVVLAIRGAGAWALIGQQVALAAIQCMLSFAVGRFWPGWPRGFTPLGDHIRFARDNIGVSLLMTGQRQAPNLLIGYILGAAPLGLFSMGQRVLNLPQASLSGPVAQVVYVRMAAAQKTPEKIGEIYIASIRLMALVVLPPMAVLAGAGHWIFPVLLSEDWAGVALIFALAAPGFAIEAVTATAGVLFQAVDRTGLRLRMATERALLRTLAIAIAVPFGIEAVALSITLFALAFTPRYLGYASRAVPLNRRRAIAAMAIPALIGGLAWGGLALLEAPVGMLWSMVLALGLAWALSALLQMRELKHALRVFGS